MIRRAYVFIVGLLWMAGTFHMVGAATTQEKDYLSSFEADKIRDAEQPSERIKLFLTFAADRLKKFHYTKDRQTPDRQRKERLNCLLEAYTSCIEDAVELISLGREKQTDIHAGIKELRTKGKEYLAELERLAAARAEVEAYRENLNEAIQVTRDALAEAEKAAKEIAPPPVRRRP